MIIVSFAVAMALVGAAIVMNLVTWWVTRRTERETRVLKLERVRAGKRGETVLEDVEIDEEKRRFGRGRV
jgi:phosphatidylserine decarboxylase